MCFFIIICFSRFEVKPSRQAEGAASLQAQWGFEELGSQDEQLGGDECESHLGDCSLSDVFTIWHYWEIRKKPYHGSWATQLQICMVPEALLIFVV